MINSRGAISFQKNPYYPITIRLLSLLVCIGLLCFPIFPCQETLPRWDASALTQLCAGLAASRRAARQPLESLEVKGVNGWGRLVHRCVEAMSSIFQLSP
jgi:hypothetical protein